MKYDKKQAKMDVLKEIIEHMDSMGGKSLADGLQKVTVAAKDKSGLIEGLTKAKELMSSEEPEEEESKEEMLKKLLAMKK